MTAKTNYVPGVCNINPQEIRQRRMTGHLGIVVSLVLITAIFALHVSWYLRIILVIPTFLAAIGYLQAYYKFCVSYASTKQHHADAGDIVDIVDKHALELDRKKRQKMNMQATIIAALITAVICVIPL